MSSTKNPEREAENPAPMPRDGKKSKMAVPDDAPPGLELDGKGNVIPLEKRTAADRQKARAADGED